jgi:lipid-A-disaccharide synthase
VVGLFEILAHATDIIKAYRQVTGWLAEHRPRALVLIDYPEFNLLVAGRAKKLGIPVFYYISPQIWAWRQGRVKKIKALVDRMAVILPFEKEFYARFGMEVEFVGHPLLDVVRPSQGREEFLKGLGLDPEMDTVALLPGSRQGEIRRHLAMMLEAAVSIQRGLDGACQFVIPEAPGLSDETRGFMSQEVARAAAGSGLKAAVCRGATYDAIHASRLVILASGTVALEACILNRPMIVTYRLSPITYHLGRRLIKVRWASLVNLIADRQVVPELLQDDARPDRIAGEALALLGSKRRQEVMKASLQEVTARLGQKGAARKAARLLKDLIDGPCQHGTWLPPLR